jgi:hypothetical protein
MKRVVGEASFLFTQFSSANWIGNSWDETNVVPESFTSFAVR